MKDCFFCNISTKKGITEIIMETDNFYVMLNEHKLARAGAICMVCTKQHIPYIYELDKTISDELMELVIKTANLLRYTYQAKGIRIWLKNGKSAGQTIEHLHFHIMPSNSALDFPLLLLKFTYNIIEGLFIERRKISPLKLRALADQLRSNISNLHSNPKR